MATNQIRWVGNLHPGITGPVKFKGSCQAGATQALKRGELCELTGNTNTQWVPIDSDADFAANLAICDQEVVSGDVEGFKDFIAPAPGDIFSFELAAAAAPAIGASVYYSSSEKLALSGTYAIGKVVAHSGIPEISPSQAQGHLIQPGITVGNTTWVDVTFNSARSYYAALQG